MRSLFCLAVLMAMIGCSGGGGSGDGSNQTETERSIAFEEEAIALAYDRSHASCTVVTCAKPEHTDHWYDFINDLEKGGCEYSCVPVAIDESGEIRYYSLWIVFERFPDGCFDEGRMVVFSEVFSLCHESF